MISMRKEHLDKDETDGNDVLEAFMDSNQCYRFEGDAGLDNLEKLFGVLGYTEDGFRHGAPVEKFLIDNPGAIEAIIDFVAASVDQAYVSDDTTWREALVNETVFGDEEEE